LLGDRSSAVFGPAGGTIGRSADNDWVLPDPLRYVSAHHARVFCRDGAFVLEDVSTNGSFVNDDDQPLSRRGPHTLAHGDVLRLGEYHVLVSIEGATAETAGPSPVPTNIQALRGIGRAAQTDIGAALNLEDLLIADHAPTGRFQAVNAFGQAVNLTPRSTPSLGSVVPGGVSARAPMAVSSAPGAPAVQGSLAINPSVDDPAAARRVAHLAKAAARDAAAAAGQDVQSGLQAFCRGAGVGGERLPAEAQTRFLHLAGRLFRELLVAMKELERSRDETRSRFHVETAPDATAGDQQRPSLAKSTIDELLVELFEKHENRELDAVQWLRELVNEGKNHERGTEHAMRAAFVEFTDRLDPAELEARFERAARRGKLRTRGREQYWDLYTDFYRSLIEMPVDHLPHTFVEAFANAYRNFAKKP